MNRPTANAAILALAALALLNPRGAGAQTDYRELAYRQSVDRALAAGESHGYRVTVDSARFVFVSVEQQGIDVRVAVIGPRGDTVAAVDSPNGAYGLEPVTLVSRDAGDFRIVVRPLDDAAKGGRYTITFERLEPAATTPAGQVSQFFAAWDRPGSPGAAVAVVRDGEIVLSQGHGLANLEYDIPITPGTIFHVASLSKQFTAFAVTMLAVEGRISLDDDVRTYVPELHDFGDTITIRHLLHHTSGLRDQWALLTLAGWRMDDVITRNQILRLIARQRELNFRPGAEYLYSNTGYTLLAEIVARVTGEDFPEWTVEHLFRPLGMLSTHFHDSHETIVPNRAYSYQSGPAGGFRRAVLNYATVGATSLFTTAEDLAKWAHNFETGAVGGPEVIRLMRTRGVLNNGDTLDYAFGQAIGSYHGLRALSHSGADAGFRAYLIRFPHQSTSVAVLSNLASFDASGMARQVADLYLRDQFAAPVAAPEESDRTRAPVAIDPGIIDRYLGDYVLQPGVLVSVSRHGDHLSVDVTGRQEVSLVAASDSRFFVEGTDIQIDFVHDGDGPATALTLAQSGQTLTAYRIEPFDPGGVDLSRYEGEFYSDELATTYTLAVENGVLRATHLRHEPITLTPTTPDAFAGDTWFMARLLFERDDAGQITGFRVSSGRVRNLLFVKSRGSR